MDKQKIKLAVEKATGLSISKATPSEKSDKKSDKKKKGGKK
jgi:hypothetical protein